MKITYEVMELRSRHPFHIARAAAPPLRQSVWLRIRDGDHEGWGEAAPSPYYGESVDSVVAVLPRIEQIVARDAADAGTGGYAARMEAALAAAVPGHPAARAAVSAALHDLAGQRSGQPVWRMWGLSAAATPLSSFTIGIDEPAVMLRRIGEAASYPVLKLKVGTRDDASLLERVRAAAPESRIRIDANTAWTLDQAIALVPTLESLDIEMIEQPFMPGDIESFRALRERTTIPVIADESCLVEADVARLAGAVDGINIKLEKCGSLGEARRMVQTARTHEMQVMIGCMLSTTLAVAATMQLAPLVDYADLDAARLITNDPFEGPRMEANGRLVLNDGPGLGVRRRDT